MLSLDSPVSGLKSIGPAYSRRLKRLNIFRVKDLLDHFPNRYEDYSKTTTIDQLKIGEAATIRGKIVKFSTIKTPKKGIYLTTAVLTDQTGSLKLTWFKQPYLHRCLRVGDKLAVAGKICAPNLQPEIISPVWETTNSQPTLHLGRLVPVYPETKNLSSRWLRSKIFSLLNSDLVNQLKDPLPKKISQDLNFPSLELAINQVHFPTSLKEAYQARQRFAFSEALIYQLVNLKLRRDWQRLTPTFKFDSHRAQKSVKDFINSLPFRLTGAQQRAIDQILDDLNQNHVMNRLLVGDVGSGKTVVAQAAGLAAIASGWQAALMVPTEILANQHYHSLSKLYQGRVSVGLLTASTKPKKRKFAGQAQLIVGTHALLWNRDWANKLGLIIIDEQHRFGVQQRASLQSKAKNPHLLTISATPIPRSLSLTVFGHLKLSFIDEKPTPSQIKTWVVPESKREAAYAWLSKKLSQDAQALVVCPLINESELNASLKAAKIEHQKLKKLLPQVPIGLVHGQLKTEEKQKSLDRFRLGEVRILVASSVVEVGIDVPDASIILIEGAERFGLAQLHQLRGRVGRAGQKAYCLLFPSVNLKGAISRLKTLETTQDGFTLAELDLRLRGPGSVLGTAQHGWVNLKHADLFDPDLLEQTRSYAQALERSDPDLVRYPQLKEEVEKVFERPISPT